MKGTATHGLGRTTALIAGLWLVAASAAHSAPLRSDFPWQAWGPEVFARAASENKFVLLSLQAWWCEPCHRMNSVTYDDAGVRDMIGRHFIPVYLDQDAQPDISQRFERWGWPATVIFGADGTEIVKLRGFYSPQFFLPILQATVDDPSPVDYGQQGGPERPASEQISLGAERRDFLLDFYDNKAYDTVNGGWGTRSKLVDGPTLELAVARAGDGDAQTAARLRETLDRMLGLIDPETGAVSQLARPDWSGNYAEYPMFAQEAALRAFSFGYTLFNEERYRAGAERVVGFLRDTMSAPDGGFYASYGKESFAPGVDRRRYARENGKAIAGLLAYYDATHDPAALALAESSARWVLANRRLSGGGFSHAARDRGGPFLADSVEMARALLHLHRSSGEREWLSASAAAADFILRHFVDPATGGFNATVPSAAPGMPAPVKQKDDNVLATRFLNALATYTGEARFAEAARRGMGYLTSDAVLEAFWYLPGVLQAERELRQEPVHVTVVGAKGDPRSADLYRAALAYPALHKRAEWWDRSEGPLANPNVRYPDLAQPAAFACTGNVCSLPVTRPDEVKLALERLVETR